MALKATIYRAELDVANIDESYYGSHTLTIACHPSETEERMMIRVLAFALFAARAPEFGRGLSAEDEPDLWVKDPSGLILDWIDIGLPEEKRLRRAAGRARRVTVFAHGGRGIDVWWERNAAAFARIAGLAVLALPWEPAKALAGLARRNMKLSCTVQDGQIWLAGTDVSVAIEPRVLQAAAA